MKGRQIAVVGVLVLICFGAGVLVGSRMAAHRNPSSSPVVTVLAQADRPPATRTPASASPPCVDIHDAGPLVGRRGCVAGVVRRAFASRSGNTFLDFCDDYRQCPFSSVIFASDKEKFGDLNTLAGKRIEIRGDVVRYQDRAEIIIRDPQQIRAQ